MLLCLRKWRSFVAEQHEQACVLCQAVEVRRQTLALAVPCTSLGVVGECWLRKTPGEGPQPQEPRELRGLSLGSPCLVLPSVGLSFFFFFGPISLRLNVCGSSLGFRIFCCKETFCRIHSKRRSGVEGSFCEAARSSKEGDLTGACLQAWACVMLNPSILSASFHAPTVREPMILMNDDLQKAFGLAL